MATSAEDVAQLLASGVATPISQLGPDLAEQSNRVVRGEVTITWPYNSVNKSLAFLLAEPDVRLRRAKGLIRVQLNGASAEAVAGCNLGGGDELRLSLDGVEWEKDDAPARPVGSRSEWQLKFSNKIILQAKLVETDETKTVNVCRATSPVPVESAIDSTPQIQNEPVIPAPAPEIPTAPTPRRVLNRVETGEYPSPAFIKRARVSYGAFLETDFDELEEDGGVKGKGRKKPRFSVGAGRWRYQSRTPSPEPEVQEKSSPEVEATETHDSPPRKPRMLDEGSQTIEEELTPISHMMATPGGQNSFGYEPSSPLERQAMTDAFAPNADMGVQTHQTAFPTNSMGDQQQLYQNTPTAYTFGQSVQQVPQNTILNARQDEYSVPRFQATMSGPQFSGPELSLGDQVRFGFSHQPQPTYSQVREDATEHPENNAEQVPDAYPETYLDHSTTPGSIPSDIHGNFAAAERMPQDHYAVVGHPAGQGHQTDDKPPPGQHEILLWPIDAPSMDYEHAVAQVDVDAPLPTQEGHHAIKDDLHSNGSEPEEEPLVSNDDEAMELQAQSVLEQPMYRQGEVEDQALAGPENDLEEEDDDISSEEEADYDEDQVGDDYDMRNYADDEDDEEGFESQEEDAPLPDGEIMDEDGEGSYDEDEEASYDEEEEEEEENNARAPQRMPLYHPPPSRAPPLPVKSSGPVVIDLISDSEDEEDNQRATVTPSHQFDGPVDNKPPVTAPGSALSGNIPISNRGLPSSNSNAVTASDRQSLNHHADLKEESPSYEVESDSGSEEDEENNEEGSASEQSEEQSDLEDEAESDGQVEEEVVTVEETRIIVEAEIIQPSSDRILGEKEGEDAETLGETSGYNRRMESPEHVVAQAMLISRDKAVTQQTQDSGVGERDVPMEDVLDDNIETHIREARSAELQDVTMADVSEVRQPPAHLGMQSRAVEDSATGVQTLDEERDIGRVLPSSPPLTQQFESQIFTEGHPPQTGSDSSQSAVNDDGGQLPTPHDTQLAESLSSQPPLDEEKVTAQVEEVTKSSVITLQPTAELASEPNQSSQPKTPTIDPSRSLDTGTSPEIVPSTIVETSAKSPVADKFTVAEATLSPSMDHKQDQEAVQTLQENDDQSEVARNQPTPKTQGSLVTAPSPIPELPDDQDKHEPVDVIKVQVEDKAETDAPAASTRRLRSRAPPPSSVDPSIQLARAAIASKRGKRATDQAPISPRTTRTRSMSFQKSNTPEAEDNSVQLARAALKSPSKRKQEPLAEQLKSDLSKRLPVEMPDCIPLKLLRSHHNKTLDIAAVATTSSTDPQRAKGARQYIMSFNVTDPSIAPSEIAEVDFFRAHKDFLPVIKPGDAVLLRNFTVTSLKDKNFGLRSHDDSSWAVFDKNDGLAQTRGPPIELNDEEIGYMTTLKKWYAALDKGARSELEKANEKFAEVNRAK